MATLISGVAVSGFTRGRVGVVLGNTARRTDAGGGGVGSVRGGALGIFDAKDVIFVYGDVSATPICVTVAAVVGGPADVDALVRKVDVDLPVVIDRPIVLPGP